MRANPARPSTFSGRFAKIAGRVAMAILGWPFLTGAAAAAEKNGVEAVRAAGNAAPAVRFAVRELYAPGHFGNSYEVMGPREMRRYLAEAKHWGFNRYGDWFDMEDCSDPFADKSLVRLGDAMWERKKENFRSAQRLGFTCDLLITPNHVYVDQCRPELLATKGKRIFGQLICPSNPKARAIILKNYQHLFADLAAAGVRLKAISSCPYDFGGCACPKCQPWILTFAKLMREIHALAERYHPGVESHMIGWWWTAEEHRLLADWADREAPGWIKSIYLHIPYNATHVADVPLPKGCRRGAFVHIGYSDASGKSRDIYGHLGPVVAPGRLPRTIQGLANSGVTAVMAYSEGVFDDVNKALLAGLASGQFNSAHEVLRAYAERYFAANPRQAEGWATWLAGWGEPFAVDPEKAAQQLAVLNPTAAGPWRQQQWQKKLELFRLQQVIAGGTAWTPERLQAVDQFWQVQEEIQRGLWGLTAQRHVFARRYTPVAWYEDWAKHATAEKKTLDKEQQWR